MSRIDIETKTDEDAEVSPHLVDAIEIVHQVNRWNEPELTVYFPPAKRSRQRTLNQQRLQGWLEGIRFERSVRELLGNAQRLGASSHAGEKAVRAAHVAVLYRRGMVMLPARLHDDDPADALLAPNVFDALRMSMEPFKGR